MRGTILAILGSWLVLVGMAGAQTPLQPFLAESRPAIRLPSTVVPPKEAPPEKHEQEHEHEEAETWKPETPKPVEEEAEHQAPWSQFHFCAEYLFWWFKDMPLPPVLTRGLVTDANPGALDQPGTVVLFGGKDLYEKPQAGVRSFATYWFDPEGCLGAEVGGFFLTSRSVVVGRPAPGSPATPVLGQPFFNAASGSEDVSLVLFPGVVLGSAHIAVTTRMWGAEANGLINLCGWRGLRVEALVGLRSLQFFENITLGQQSQVNDSVPILGGQFTAGFDSFGVTNNFYGGQVGLRTEVRNGRLFLELQGKAAVGSTQEVLNIAGQTTVLQPGLPAQTLPGSLYALSSNIGGHSKNSFAVLPEANVNFGWQMLEHLQVQLGYSFLYLSRVARAGDQIDRVLNPNLIPSSITHGLPGGPARPAVTIRESDFWVQGLNFGLELVF